MKKAQNTRAAKPRPGDLAGEYKFDYTTSKSNRFTRFVARDAVIVVLDPDVAKVFRDPRQVNVLLRAAIVAVEKPRSKRTMG